MLVFFLVTLSLAASSTSTNVALDAYRRELRERVHAWLSGATPAPRVSVPDAEINPFGDVPCATMPVFEFHKKFFHEKNVTTMATTTTAAAAAAAAAKCPQQNNCDDPTVRDNTPMTTINVHTVWTVWNNQLKRSQLDAMIAEFQQLFALDGVAVVVDKVVYVSDTTFGTCLPAYDDSDYWYDALMTLKGKHAVTPDAAMNIFVGCQEKGYQGTLLGIATFPFDPLALSEYGGLWMNVAAMFPDDATLRHETGHCFGLWHVFHGVDEEANCGADSAVCGATCCEKPHAKSDLTGAASNLEGDWCSDTMAQPRHWQCAQPKGDACNDVAWTHYGATDFENTMSYAMIDANTGKEEHCQTGFSAQQQRRMHCYLRGLLNGWTS